MAFDQIVNNIQAKKFAPVYLLHGEEEYYIDKIVESLEKHVLKEEEKGFNETVFYGNEINFGTLIEAAKRYPMMAEHQLIIVKEAQNLKKFEEFESYLLNPTPTTILVLAHKHSKIDSRKKAVKLIGKHGVVFASDRLREYQIPKWINRRVESKNYKISAKASALLQEFLGLELSKISNELDKLMLNLPEGSTIEDKDIQKFVGINKDFNYFELQNAIMKGDAAKAQQIALYFGKSQKQHPIQVTFILLLKFYVSLLRYHFVKPKDRNKERLPKAMGVSPYFLNDYVQAAKMYNGKVVFRNIGLLRKYDLMSKGKGTTDSHPSVILKELIPQLLMK